MLLPVTLSCDKNNHNGNIFDRAYFKKIRCHTATIGHLALIVLLWICPNSKKEQFKSVQSNPGCFVFVFLLWDWSLNSHHPLNNARTEQFSQRDRETSKRLCLNRLRTVPPSRRRPSRDSKQIIEEKILFPHRAKLWEASSAWTSIFYLFWFPQQPSQKSRDRS